MRSDSRCCQSFSAIEMACFQFESFVTVLRKLCTDDFSSEKLPRHCSIRRQAEKLLQSPNVLQLLHASLHKELSALLMALPTKSSYSPFQISLWPQYHQFRLQQLPLIWKTHCGDIDAILVQKATLDYTVSLLKEMYRKDNDITTSRYQEKMERKGNIDTIEENAIRYIAGYVIKRLQKKYNKKNSVSICQTLDTMAANTDVDQDAHQEEDFLEYTTTWLRVVDRGGLFEVSQEVYDFFLELEVSIYPMLKKSLSPGGVALSKKEVMFIVLHDEDVLFLWSMLSVDLNEEEGNVVLRDLIELWVTLRGYSIASRLLEEYKEATRGATKGKAPLRKQLFLQGNRQQ